MASPFFSGRIPEDLNERVQQHCQETGEGKTQLLINALSRYLDFPIKPPLTIGESSERFNQLEKRVAELEKRFVITSVSSSDNSSSEPTQPDNKVTDEDPEIPNGEPIQLSVLKNDRQGKKPLILPTTKVPTLPGLEKEDGKKIGQTLRNAKSSGKTEVVIGPYTLKYHGQKPGIKKPLLWEVITTDNK